MTPRQSGHEFIELIKQYYHGCNTADVDLMKSTFTSDVVHYFVDHSAVETSIGLASYWAKVAPLTQANWALDHAVVQDNEAVIEWSMRWQPKQTSQPEILRGTEWYKFRAGKISEIRSYHNNYYLQRPENKELWDFDYASRGYRTE